ncbi:Retrovirus-related Pol polyprotein from transposon opus [Dictyocoela muelleri]|nr:Retrovirus-related Pol polyprotein from transposon opus [Dictyocoela muelleri]
MPQGFKNSLSIFQRGISIILEVIIDVVCLVYIDDILLYGKYQNEHDKNIKLVKNRLNEYNLVINEGKSVYGKDKLIFLGYEISENTIKPLLHRSECILNYEKPRTNKQLMRFLGI